uniref:Uncharacterized protein n=1 Tax=Pipistrellus kuhlii TaxID=59472 RepID=A0A7J8B1P6_PIPKU|nr:hypothetical protein mPipKuh1_007919 [Pipistrellus kuhlii]
MGVGCPSTWPASSPIWDPCGIGPKPAVGQLPHNAGLLAPNCSPACLLIDLFSGPNALTQAQSPVYARHSRNATCLFLWLVTVSVVGGSGSWWRGGDRVKNHLQNDCKFETCSGGGVELGRWRH